MKNEDLNNALSFIDSDIVEEFTLEKEKFRMRKNVLQRIISVGKTAACLILVFASACFAITISNVDLPRSDSNAADAPPQASTTLKPPNGGDDNTAAPPPSAGYTFTFFYNGTTYTASLENEAIPEDIDRLVGTIALSEIGSSSYTYEARLYLLRDGSLAVEIYDNQYFKAHIEDQK